jgi:hypothetical protein
LASDVCWISLDFLQPIIVDVQPRNGTTAGNTLITITGVHLLPLVAQLGVF